MGNDKDSSHGSKVWKIGAIGPLVITLFNGIGWLVVYFLVLSPQVDQNRAQTKLFDAQLEKLQSAHQRLTEQLDVKERSGRVQLDDANRRFIDAQMSRLESATARLERQLANLRAQTQATADLNSVRQGLRPNIRFGIIESTFLQKDEIELVHEVKNIGSNAAIVAAPIILLSTRPIIEDGDSSALLAVNRDYSARVSEAGMLQPGNSSWISYSIKLLNKTLRGSAIHFKLMWQTSTDPSAVSTAAQILGKQISGAELKELSQFSHSLSGDITFAR
jgi:hypothetical protein